MAATPQPGTLDLVDNGTDDLRLRWGRDWSMALTLNKSTGPNVPYDFTFGSGDIDISSWQVQIRKKDADETLVCTGACSITTAASGLVTVDFPASGWATTGEADCTCRWDLVGITPSTVRHLQFVEGDADVLRTTTNVS